MSHRHQGLNGCMSRVKCIAVNRIIYRGRRVKEGTEQADLWLLQRGTAGQEVLTPTNRKQRKTRGWGRWLETTAMFEPSPRAGNKISKKEKVQKTLQRKHLHYRCISGCWALPPTREVLERFSVFMIDSSRLKKLMEISSTTAGLLWHS